VSTTATPDRFTSLPDEHALAATVVALEEHGFSVEVADDLDAARAAVLARIPEGSSVMTNTSVTLAETGIGAGAGAVYKGTTGIVLEATDPENRVAMTSDLVIAVFVGLSVPVIGAGVALNEGASAPDTVLVFAILVALGVLLSGWLLLGRAQRPS
jgi:hypothetical protein